MTLNTAIGILLTLTLTSCATEQPNIWQDFATAGHRGNPELQMDHGTCSLMRAQASVQAEALFGNPPPPNSPADRYGYLAFTQGYVVGNAKAQFANDAYSNCMLARGWRQQ